MVHGPQGLIAVGASGPDRHRIRLASGSGQAAACRPARRQGRGVSRRRGQRHARHGGGAQGGDLSRGRRGGREDGRTGRRRLCRLSACISVNSAPRAGSSWSTISWSRSTSPAPREAMALGLKAGVDVDLMIKAIATGSGGSTQFAIRAPWMAQRQFLPQQGSVPGLQHYLEMIGELRRRRRRGDAAARSCRPSFMPSSSRWDLPNETAPRWSTSSRRLPRAMKATERNSRRVRHDRRPEDRSCQPTKCPMSTSKPNITPTFSA